MWSAIESIIAIELQMKIFSNCDAENDVSFEKVKALKHFFDESRFVTCKRETNFEGCLWSRSEVDAELELLFFRFRSQNFSFSFRFLNVLHLFWLLTSLAAFHTSQGKSFRVLRAGWCWGSQNTRNENWNYEHVEQFHFTRVRFHDDDLWRRGGRAWCKNAKRASSSH